MDRLKKCISWLLVLVIVLTCNYISVVSAQSNQPYTVTIGNNAVFEISNYNVTTSAGENTMARSEFQEAETYVHNIFTGDTSMEERAWANAGNGVIFTVYGDGVQSSANATVSIKLKYYYSFARRAGASDVWAQVSASLWSYLVPVSGGQFIPARNVCRILLRDNGFETCSGEDLRVDFSVNLQGGKTYFIEIYASIDMWRYQLSGGPVEMESHNLVVIDEVQINWEAPPEEPPVASFTYLPEKPMVGGKIDFIASESPRIVEYKWDFDDGDSGSGSNVSHIFKEPRNYTVKLSVTDIDGLTDSTFQEVNLTLKNGDLLLWRTRENPFGRLGIIFWTHIGMYHEASNSVIEARPFDLVRRHPLSDWFFDKNKITCAAALEVITKDQATRDAAVSFALDKEEKGQGFDLRSILHDEKQDGTNLTAVDLKWYCSELVWAAYKSASNGQINLDPDNDAVSPDEINNSQHTKFLVAHMEDIPDVVWTRYFYGQASCPVDLEITDPDGLVLNKQGSEIPGAIYEEGDIDGDGDLDDFFAVPEPKEGDYLIYVIPEPGASPTDTYSLEVAANGVVVTLAEDVQVNNIPAQPYIVRSTESEITPVIRVTIDFDPDTLNLKSKGEWITVYVELPVGHGYAVGDIDVGRTFVEGLLEVQHSDVQDGVLMVKFDRQDVIIYLESVVGVIPPDDIPLAVTGELKDGRRFEGSDIIRVIH